MGATKIPTYRRMNKQNAHMINPNQERWLQNTEIEVFSIVLHLVCRKGCITTRTCQPGAKAISPESKLWSWVFASSTDLLVCWVVMTPAVNFTLPARHFNEYLLAVNWMKLDSMLTKKLSDYSLASCESFFFPLKIYRIYLKSRVRARESDRERKSAYTLIP